jgi:signal transduction histidine kinase/DNA-binding NarL/FixJ family response regulator
LLVDDSEAFLRSASALLGSQGLVIVGQASSGPVALQLAAAVQPNVILVDVELGPEDGLEVARHLVIAHPRSKVVLISLRDQDELFERIEDTGAIGFLRKDVLNGSAITDLIKSTDRPGSALGPKGAQGPSSIRESITLQEEAALRRVATMVAHEFDVCEVVQAVTEELADLLGLHVTVALEPPESTGTSRTAVDSDVVSGPATKIPLIVDGTSWGTILVETMTDRSRMDDRATRYLLGEFAALTAKAVDNERNRTELREMVYQHAALRSVATLVAQGAGPEGIFDAIVDGATKLLGGFGFIRLLRFDRSTRTLTDASTQTPPEIRDHVGAGAQFDLDESPLAGLVVRTGQLARIEDWSTVPGELAERHVRDGFGPAIGVPVMVDGIIWGAMTMYCKQDHPIPVGSELRLADFAQLMATALANVQARSILRDLAEWQSSLGRIATLVAQGNEPESVFTAVAQEAARILNVGAVSLIRYDVEDHVLVKLFGTHGGRSPVPDGASFRLEDAPLESAVLETGKPARLDDWSELPGPVAAGHIESGFGQGVSSPVIINNSLWGFVSAFGEAGEVLPSGSESRLAEFTHLMASAISNAEARSALRSLAEQQGAALRRVATLVAQQASPSVIFAAVADEARRALGVQVVDVFRRFADGSLSLLGSTARHDLSTAISKGEILIASMIADTGQAARIGDGPRTDGSETFERGNTVGAPIYVDAEMWGLILISSPEDLPEDAETRLADFTHLVASSISNVQARENLLASRARIVSASDEARRRIERDLHDGVQQKLVSLGMNLQEVRIRYQASREMEKGLDELARDLEIVIEEIRVFSQGLHPALLSRSGLGPSLRSLARRSAIPVEFEVEDGIRLPELVEIAIYFAVSEALANATKHSRASSVSIRIDFDGFHVLAAVSDDGIGGASLSGGSGLIGLVDRIEALGGHVNLNSPANGGTTVTVTLPNSTSGRS